MPPGRPVGSGPAAFALSPPSLPALSPSGAPCPRSSTEAAPGAVPVRLGPGSEPHAQSAAASSADGKQARVVIAGLLSIVPPRQPSSVDPHNPCCAEAHICANLRYVSLDFEDLATDFIRALRGPRSQMALSRRLGFRTNVL